MRINFITRLFPVAVLAVGLVATSLGQSAGPTGGQLKPSERKAGQKHPLLDALAKLDLSPDQKVKIKDLEKIRNDDVSAFRKAHKGDMVAIKAHAEDATKTFLIGIKAVLTQAQWDQFQAELRAMRQKRGKRNPENGTGTTTPPAQF
jgi:hypothetical protein